jgi:hypothetical protein
MGYMKFNTFNKVFSYLIKVPSLNSWVLDILELHDNTTISFLEVKDESLSLNVHQDWIQIVIL